MPGPVIAAACGPVVTTWDLSRITTENKRISQNEEDTNFIDSFRPYGDIPVVDLSWTHNASAMATCSAQEYPTEKNDKNVAITILSDKSKSESFSNFFTPFSSTRVTSSPSNTTSISFGGKQIRSRYLCISDYSGYISVWDIKKNSRARKFRTDGPCIAASFDATDSYIVGLSKGSGGAGILELFHLRDKKLIMSLMGSDDDYGNDSMSIECFSCSNIQSNKLLGGTNTGDLLLWDYSDSYSLSSIIRKPFCKMANRHVGTVTSVKFHPTKEVLAASCATDGTVMFHDININKRVEVVSVPHNTSGVIDAVTSLSFYQDGLTWALGTQSGNIYVYDLRRSSKEPLHSFHVDENSPIKSLEFAPSIPNQSKTPKSTKKAIGNNMNPDVQTETSSTVYEVQEAESVVEKSDKNEKSKEIVNDQRLIDSTPANLNFDINEEITSDINVKHTFSVDTMSSLQDEQYQTRHRTPNVSNADSNREHQYEDQIENTDIYTTALSHHSSSINSEKGIDNNYKIGDNVTNTAEIQLKPKEDSSHDDLVQTSAYKSFSDGVRFSEIENINKSYNNKMVEKPPVQSTTITKNEINSLIQESIECLRDQMEDTIRHLHCDFLRELQRQHDEMTEKFRKQQSQIDDLTKENQRLQKENSEMRLF